MFKSYSQQSIGLKNSASHLPGAPTQASSVLCADKYQSWKFFNPSAVTINSYTLSKAFKSPPTQLSPVRKSLAEQQPEHPFNNISNINKFKESLAMGHKISLLKSKSVKKGMSFVDHILDAATKTNEAESKDFFLTHVQTESILPPIKLGDNKEYRSLMQQQQKIPYILSKHVRLASERQKYGKLENIHYQHYERLEPIESVLAKVKPSEKTLNYKPKVHNFQKPSLELMKTLNKKLQEEREKPGQQDDNIKKLEQDTYQIFGMNQEDIDDVNAILAEEGDKIDVDAKEIKFTEHQLEFRSICTNTNKEKSAEIFLKTNKDYSIWNLKDRSVQQYFLSRAAVKEPRDFIEKEIEERKLKGEEYFYRKPVVITKVESQLEGDMIRFEELEKAKMRLKQQTEGQVVRERGDEEYGSEYEYYTEGYNRSQDDMNEGGVFSDELLSPSVEDRMRNTSLSLGHSLKKKSRNGPRQGLAAKTSRGGTPSQSNREDAFKPKEHITQKSPDLMDEEELKKFIFLEKLKYEKAIKGYDRVAGLKVTLEQFTEALMEKLFQKREPINELKYILKRDNNLKRTDNSKPLYLDDLKRYQKLQQVTGLSKLNLVEHGQRDIIRNFKDINIFNAEDEQEELLANPKESILTSQSMQTTVPAQSQLKLTMATSRTKLYKPTKTLQQKQQSVDSLPQDLEKNKKYTGAWYLPVKKWGDIKKYPKEGKEISSMMASRENKNIGSLTKNAILTLVEPFKEGGQRKNKLTNRTDETVTGGSTGL